MCYGWLALWMCFSAEDELITVLWSLIIKVPLRAHLVTRCVLCYHAHFELSASFKPAPCYPNRSAADTIQTEIFCLRHLFIFIYYTRCPWHRIPSFIALFRYCGLGVLWHPYKPRSSGPLLFYIMPEGQQLTTPTQLLSPPSPLIRAKGRSSILTQVWCPLGRQFGELQQGNYLLQ